MTKAVIRFLVAAISTVVAVALGYMAFLAVDVNRRSIQTVKVQMATAEIGENIDAMMFSDDILVLKNRGQSCQILVENGEKVGGGEAVAVVFDDEASRQKYVQLEELRDTMAIVSKARQTKTDSAALKTLNSRLSDIAGDFTARTGQGDADFQSSKSDMLLAMMSRELCLGNANEINVLYDTLKREISDLELETADLRYIDAERSGYFSALADGWEQVISLERLLEFSCDDYLAAVSVGPLTIDMD
ncbi:MAG: hypothetical protein IKZ19_08300, partial [Clostridia bacterium]|nr:hypothetical protein [Clostridia bacterium]